MVLFVWHGLAYEILILFWSLMFIFCLFCWYGVWGSLKFGWRALGGYELLVAFVLVIVGLFGIPLWLSGFLL
jgi:hypothetical protein